MAVPSSNSHLKNTTGGAYTAQTVGGVVMGNENTSGPLTAGLSLLDAATLNAHSIANTLPIEGTANMYTTKKPYSSGTFAYNAARAGTWVIAKVSETLSGVSNTKLLFMGEPSLSRNIHDFQHDFGVKMLTQWVTKQFAWTGKLASGASVKSRNLWLNAAGTAVEAPATLSGTFMFDISDNDATDKAVDDAATPTRAIPGELVLMADFVTAGLSGGNHFDYKPITGV